MYITLGILECLAVAIAGIAGWFALTRKITNTENDSISRPQLTRTGRVAGVIFIISISTSLVLAILKQGKTYLDARAAAANHQEMVDKLNAAEVQIRQLRELSSIIRKTIVRIVYKVEKPTVETHIELWQNTSSFSIFRRKLKIGSGPYDVPQAFELAVSGDASFFFRKRKGDNIGVGMYQSAPQERVLAELPVQFRVGPLLSFLETRVSTQNLFVVDLLHSNIGFTFKKPGSRKISADVLREIGKIQVYADMADGKVVVCTYSIETDNHLRKTATSMKSETVVETPEYYLHEWPENQHLGFSAGLSVYLYGNAFEVEQRQRVLEILPKFEDTMTGPN